MAAFKTLDDYDLAGKRVLLRADLNVPVADGKVTDATRIERLVPTIREIIKVEGKAIILSHFGRPKGKVDPEFSLEQVIPSIVELTGHPVGFIDTDWVDVSRAKQAIDEAPAGSILVLENTRFHKGEEDNDPNWPSAWPRSATSMSTTPSRRRTAPMPRPRAWRTCCRRPPGVPWKPNCWRSNRVSAIRSGK